MRTRTALYGCDVLGIDSTFVPAGATGTIYNADGKTVTAVQRAITSLPQASLDIDFKALAAALKKDPSSYGSFGKLTKAAVAKFNYLYGGDPYGGENITDLTLQALKVTSPLAQSNKAEAKVDAAVQTVTPTASPVVVQQAQAQVAQAAVDAQQATKDASPEVQAKAAEAKVAAVEAKTPAEIKAAAERVREVTQAVRAESQDNFFTKQYAGVPLFGWVGIGTGGFLVLGIGLKFIFGGRR